MLQAPFLANPLIRRIQRRPRKLQHKQKRGGENVECAVWMAHRDVAGAGQILSLINLSVRMKLLPAVPEFLVYANRLEPASISTSAQEIVSPLRADQ